MKGLEQILDQLSLPDGIKLNVTVDGRRPSCYQCGWNNHLKAFCPQLKQKENTTSLIQLPPKPEPLKRMKGGLHQKVWCVYVSVT